MLDTLFLSPRKGGYSVESSRQGGKKQEFSLPLREGVGGGDMRPCQLFP